MVNRRPAQVSSSMSLSKSDHATFSDAIQCGDVDTVKSLIKQHPEIVNHLNWTPPPLHCAVLWDQPKIAELLLKNGADIEIKDPDRQTTPLRYAILYCKPDLIELLLNYNANTGPIIENGTSALQLAKDAAAGMFEEYDDLPKRAEYKNVINILQQAGGVD